MHGTRQPRPLKFTFILAMVAFSGLLSLTLAAVATYRSTMDLREQVVSRGEQLVAELAGEAVRLMAIADPLERELSLNMLTHRLTIGDVLYAQVVRGGRVVTESALSKELLPPVEPDPGALPALRETVTDRHLHLDLVRVLPGESSQSYVRLGVSLEVVEEKVRKNWAVMLGLTAMFTAIGAALAFGLYSAILKPLERVMASIRRLGAGDLGARVTVQGSQELQELARAFNRMAEEIARRSEELERVNAELRSAYRAKSEFLAMIGHELKTPLHSVRGYCQLLLEGVDGPLTAEQRADIHAVLAAGNHLLSLIDNILNYNASGTDRLHVTAVPLPSLLAQAVDHVRPLAQRKGLELVVNPGDVDTVHGDETKIKQIFINLLHNAVKYTPAGRISVAVEREPTGHVRIAVTDSGPGIPPDHRERIFEPFERLHDHEPGEQKGLGLGLAVVRLYAEAHGGQVTVEDGPGGGSCFVVRLPGAPAAGSEHQVLDGPVSVAHGAGSPAPTARAGGGRP
ncbi:MAG TPA: HAMP domain-containing sensor histidine kinase [Limnochordales bacterium]|nr:HAMP domain-containing sensor histidine kinase [Limnochordales bacterium]